MQLFKKFPKWPLGDFFKYFKCPVGDFKNLGDFIYKKVQTVYNICNKRIKNMAGMKYEYYSKQILKEAVPGISYQWHNHILAQSVWGEMFFW